jgi:phage repressor protein C with HTH and peptisase S24 domain
VLSISVDSDDNENIELVPVKASAGYLNGFSDPQFISALPKFHLPMFKQGTYRAFEINGDSMLPLQSGTIVVGEYLENWNELKPNDTYVIISKGDGLVYKRVGNKYKENKSLKLISDNPVYEPYNIAGEDVLEIWKAKAYISTSFPEPAPEPTLETITSMMSEMQKSLKNLHEKS